MVDIGTGDGTFAYHLAKTNPQSLVIGIDACHENLIDISSKTLRKPEKGGLSNILFVLANAEQLPDELTGIADQIYINFPWGSLLQGIVLVNDQLWNNIKKISKPDATIQIIFGYDKQFDQKEIERLQLPPLDESYVTATMIPKLQILGFKPVQIKQSSATELSNYPTSWAKKLSFGRDRVYYQLKLTAKL